MNVRDKAVQWNPTALWHNTQTNRLRKIKSENDFSHSNRMLSLTPNVLLQQILHSKHLKRINIGIITKDKTPFLLSLTLEHTLTNEKTQPTPNIQTLCLLSHKICNNWIQSITLESLKWTVHNWPNLLIYLSVCLLPHHRYVQDVEFSLTLLHFKENWHSFF